MGIGSLGSYVFLRYISKKLKILDDTFYHIICNNSLAKLYILKICMCIDTVKNILEVYYSFKNYIYFDEKSHIRFIYILKYKITFCFYLHHNS